MSEQDNAYQKIVSSYEKRDFVSAVKNAEKFTKDFPENSDGWNLLGLSNKGLGNAKEALAIFTRLVESEPKKASYHSNLGNLQQSTGQIRESIKSFQTAITLDPKLVNAIEALGLSLLELNRTADAKRCFERVLELDPSHQRSLYFLGNIYMMQMRWSEAAEHLKRSEFGLSQSHYLECLLCLKKGKEFLAFYQQLQRRGITNPLIGGLVGHIQELYKREVSNSFCNNAMDYLYLGRITANDGFTDSLAMQLLDYHRQAKNDFRSQSLLHNGEQSSGNIFLVDQPFVQQLRTCIEKQISLYREKYKNQEEGFLLNWPSRYELFGWLVSMRDGGNLDAHNHKEGWLSGSFYLKLPESRINKSDEGKIAFSYKGPRYPSDGHTSRRRVIDIKARDICMFPSSLFHETLPFHASEERVSFAFDLKPKA